jgi:hypothetical protein
MTHKKTIAAFMVIVSLMSLSCRRGTRTIVFESGHYYIDPTANIRSIGKVVIVEFDNHSTNPEIPASATEAISEALQKKHMFAVRTIRPADEAWHSLDIENISSFAPKELLALRQQLNADAIIFGSVTQYYPYPHLLMGLNMKMVDLKRGKTAWAMEQVWDSSDKSMEIRMKQYSKDQMRSGYQPLDWQLFITSPRAFNKFIAAEIAQTFSRGFRYAGLRTSANMNRQRSYQR